MNYDDLVHDMIQVCWAAERHEFEKEVNALRAVVELHKPTDEMEEGQFKCVGCGYDDYWGEWNEKYPCPTIQAIEKELS